MSSEPSQLFPREECRKMCALAPDVYQVAGQSTVRTRRIREKHRGISRVKKCMPYNDVFDGVD